jgi:glucokinase
VNPTRHLGIDLGGTNIKSAVIEVHPTGEPPRVIHSSSAATHAEDGPDAVTERLIAAGLDAQNSVELIASIGLGVPGLFDGESGRVELFPNLPGPWRQYPLRSRVSGGLGRELSMINDARAFTLAEGTIGAGRGAAVMLGVALGTGIGGGVMIDGQLHLGAFGTAGEFGHQTVDPSGPVCGCGNQGCLEAVARGEVVASAAGASDVRALYAALESGDEAAIAATSRSNMFMAIAISNAISLLGIDVVVVGGGVVSSGDLVLEPLRQAVEKRVTLVPTKDIRIVPASLGPMAGAIGAALAGMD